MLYLKSEDSGRAQVIYRSSLERQMPNSRAVFRKLFSTIQLSEPRFSSVIIMYRKKVRRDLVVKRSPNTHPIALRLSMSDAS